MATISKADLVKSVAATADVSNKDAKLVIDAFLEHTASHLAQGDKVQLTGFGTFEVRERSARTGVKPGTNEKIQIAASKYPAFKAGQGLKQNIS